MSSKLPRACLALAIVFAALGGDVREAAACTCVRPENAPNMSDDELLSWRFNRAQTVVSGVVTDFRAGETTTREGKRVVVAKFRVKSVLKGDAAIGQEMSLVTGFGTGDCGLAGPLLMSSYGAWEMALSVQSGPEPENDYSVSSCGYVKLSAQDPRREK